MEITEAREEVTRLQSQVPEEPELLTPSSMLFLLCQHSPTQVPVDFLEEEEPGKSQLAGEGRVGGGQERISVGVSGPVPPLPPTTLSIGAHWVAFSGRLAQAQPSGVGGYLSPHFTVV